MADERQAFLEAQRRMLERYGVELESTYVEVPSIEGRAHVLIGGEGPDVVLVNGIGTPAAMWAPLMAKLGGYRLYGVDLPGFGLTDPVSWREIEPREGAVRFLEEVLGALGLSAASFITNSLGSLFTSWLALERPQRLRALVYVGNPAVVLDTSAPLPMRLLSVPILGRIMTRLQAPSPKQVEQLSKMVKEYPLVPELADLLLATERLPGFREPFLTMLNALLWIGGNREKRRLRADQLAEIGQPTLVFWGKDDPFGSPEVGRRIVGILPDAGLEMVGGGHTPWVKHSDRIAPTLRSFLERHS